MKPLFITQKVDRDDDLLGVYHCWIEELAKRIEAITVICLYKGVVALPANVRVLSLGKEKGSGKIMRVFRFYWFILREMRRYDIVFVHMNTIYVLFGAWWWKLTRKKIVLWFAHYRPNWQLKISQWLVNVIVTSVREACAITSQKVVAVGQGIDVEKFKGKNDRGAVIPAETGIQNQIKKKSGALKILFLGRISPVKDLETLIEAARLLHEKGTAFTLTIVGSPTNLPDEKYFAGIKEKAKVYHLDDAISFRERVPNRETPEIYTQHDLFINLTTTGSFDKSILEAMSCELPVIVSNKAYLRIFPEKYKEFLLFKEKDTADIAEKIESFAARAPKGRREIGKTLREIVVQKHNLYRLADTLTHLFESLTL